MKPGQVDYGHFPPSLIDHYIHSIQQLIEKDIDLHRIWSSAENSYYWLNSIIIDRYELYEKSRSLVKEDKANKALETSTEATREIPEIAERGPFDDPEDPFAF